MLSPQQRLFWDSINKTMMANLEPSDLLLLRPRSSHGPMATPPQHDFPAPMKLYCTRPKQFRRNQDGKIEFGSENCKDCKRVNGNCSTRAWLVLAASHFRPLKEIFAAKGRDVPSKAIASWKHHRVGSKRLSYCMFQHEIHLTRVVFV